MTNDLSMTIMDVVSFWYDLGMQYGRMDFNNGSQREYKGDVELSPENILAIFKEGYENGIYEAALEKKEK